MANNTSQHILGTAANLLGFCLFIFISFHVADRAQASYIDEVAAGVATLLIFSCLFSFISLRTNNPGRQVRFETIAEYLFLSALIGILLMVLFILLTSLHLWGTGYAR